MAELIPTRLVRLKASGDEVRINVGDFNSAEHDEPEKPKAAKQADAGRAAREN